MQEMKGIKKLTLGVNTGLLIFVLFMIFAFAYYGVTYMVWHSIPTAAVYVGLYWLIRKEKLDLYVWIIYILITLYMIAGTICMGFNAGYLMYCTSLIPLSFYMEYLAYKLHTRKANALVTSALLVIIYLVCASYVFFKGPVYEVEPIFLFRCLIGNSIGVFFFLVAYGRLVHKMVRDSEIRLAKMAHTDQLTGLGNRRYIMGYLTGLSQQLAPGKWIAMADIDNFKDINDTYGHQVGDRVLEELARIMDQVCVGCQIARWGGEEFLIVGDSAVRDPAVMETLRRAVEEASFEFDGQTVPVSITVGTADYVEQQSIDHWIQSADRKLYVGKNSGKNQVVF